MKNQLIVAIIITFFTLTACNTAENNDVAEDEAMTNEETTNETTTRSEEHTSELQSLTKLVCRLLLEKKKNKNKNLSNSQLGYRLRRK